MRKLLFSLMAVALVFGVYGGVAYGKKPAKDTNYIDKLTEEVFQEVHQMKSTGASEKEVKKYLKKNGFSVANIGVSYFDENGKTVEVDDQQGDVSINATDPAKYKIEMWSTYYDRDRTRWTFYGFLDRSTYENYPASYDVFGIDWDKNVFQYYDWGTSDETYGWLKDASKREYGTVLFSLRIIGWIVIAALTLKVLLFM